MIWRVDRLDISTNIQLVGILVKVSDSWVSTVVCAEDSLCLLGLVEAVDVGDCEQLKFQPSRSQLLNNRLTSQDSQRGLVTEVTEGDPAASLQAEFTDASLGDVEGDRHGEQGAIGETKSVSNADHGASRLVSFRMTDQHRSKEADLS